MVEALKKNGKITRKGPVVLVIMDGVGFGKYSDGDAVARAAGRVVVSAETGKPMVYNKPDLHNPWFLVEA